ncbi:major facilitator superfamily domain-containing protein 6-like [Montipora foliosa]|uniref:major facilitator superfamily domain-containing protein 6-like n=1 Tax=Montipora foliosa TaxID=591990 RepID=UPI0035F1D2AF
MEQKTATLPETSSSKTCQRFEEKSVKMSKTILDLVDKDLVIPKLSFFFFFMATGAFLPYLGVFYKQLWLTARESGILLGVRPFVKMLCSPLWGMVTDVCNRPKLILIISIIGTTIAHFSQSVVSPFDLPCYPEANGTNFSQATQMFFPGRRAIDRSTRRHLTRNSQNVFTSKTRMIISRGGSNETAGSVITNEEGKFAESFERGTIWDFENDVGHGNSAVAEGTRVENSEDEGPRRGDNPRLPKEGQSKILTKNKKRKKQNIKEDFRVKDNQTIFITLLVIVFLGEFIAAPAPMLTDSGTLGILSGREHEYGRQRLFGSIGWGIGSLISGAVVTAFNSCPFEDSINYVSIFYVFAVAMIMDFFVAFFFKFPTSDPKHEVSAENEFWKGLKIFCNLKNGTFIFTLLFLGFSHSLQLSFLFWFLQDIGGTPILFTLIVAVNCLSEVLMFFMATYFVQKIGHDAVLYTGLACYGLRFLLYSYLREPWWVLPLEALQGFTYGGVWTASVAYVGPQPGSGATIQGIIHGVYWGLGMAIGGVLGGIMVHQIGARLTFRLEAAFSFVILVLFFAINNLHEKRKRYSTIPSDEQETGDETEEGDTPK